VDEEDEEEGDGGARAVNDGKVMDEGGMGSKEWVVGDNEMAVLLLIVLVVGEVASVVEERILCSGVQ
jgi:hypothetical protein